MLNTHSYITPILSSLFQAEHRRLDGTIKRLHLANKTAWGGKEGNGFIHQGEFYVPSGTPAAGRKFLPIHCDMLGEADEFVADKQKIGNDSQVISQLLFKLLEPCGICSDLNQDIRDAIPDCITDTLPPEVKALGRIRQPTFFLNHERDLRLYNQVIPTIEFYSIARLIY